MSVAEYRIPAFYGIDQSAQEGAIDAGSSPDACNMDTEDGSLAVAHGFVKHVNAKVDGTKPIRRLLLWQGLTDERFVVIAGNDVYALNPHALTPAWELKFSYPETVTALRVDACEAMIGSEEYLLIACGEHQILKWSAAGTIAAFGTEANSQKHVNFLAMHYGRLFAAGDPDNPSLLYYSQLPGSGRTIESWAVDAASENTGGGSLEVGETKSDPITGLCALSNQLLIFKRRSIYRLFGDRPGNFRVQRVHAEVERTQYSSIVRHGDAPYWMTEGGLYYFDGQTALKSRYARRISTFLSGASFTNCRAAKKGDKLYFTAYELDRDLGGTGGARVCDNALLVYDLARQTYMVRRGFEVSDLCARDGVLYFMNKERVIYRFDEGADYDGTPIEAYWRTPLTDLNSKPGIKCLQELYLRGTSDGEGAVLLLDARIGRNMHSYRCLMPEREEDVLEIPLKNEGRTFSLRFSNEAGSRFTIFGGLQLLFEHRLRAT